MAMNKHCPKCGGVMGKERSEYGEEWGCINCGYREDVVKVRNIFSPPQSYRENFQAGIERGRRQQRMKTPIILKPIPIGSGIMGEEVEIQAGLDYLEETMGVYLI
jgi:ssDNA-binding Zn-finger/Zn-ribbon topoisomerase 1